MILINTYMLFNRLIELLHVQYYCLSSTMSKVYFVNKYICHTIDIGDCTPLSMGIPSTIYMVIPRLYMTDTVFIRSYIVKTQ